ncbi:PTS N-acetylglucosamine transporter subunit IIBC [Companilactobacillus zhachilii]|uniref:PTS sugar transporter subunit IIA n=1 Tax=Companilactobacillus zhachilii TaxID=2304606 RepID=UPI001923AEF0|nr:PTS N-acetylglucosamine transporter subunit IIBC [Companilactobacillus zhachilii]MBL3531750.1 PTS N-acetylglucosamine transporter subunit IIBC [Companilactobacillus zhachilii]
MKRHYVIASHSTFSAGMANALRFFAGDDLELTVLTAYVDNKPIDEQVKDIFDNIPEEDEVIVLTDLMGGSVNQKFFPYIYRQHTHVITGMNLSLAMAIVMEPVNDYLSADRIREIVEEAKKQLTYVNDVASEQVGDDDDE